MTGALDTGPAAHSPLVSIHDLNVTFPTPVGSLYAVRDVTLDVEVGDILGIMGESGCGKSTLAWSMLNALPIEAKLTGSITYSGYGDVMTMRRDALRKLRWETVSLVFQGSQNSLNPLERIGSQVEDLGAAHGRSRKAAREHASRLCSRLRLDPRRVLRSYPHELSGGMKQRVEIMLALVLDPQLVVFDEPTTALDTVTQDLVLTLIRELKEDLDITAVFITHDVAVLAELATKVAVMYAGSIVELGPADDVFTDPRHPYTRALLNSLPRLTGDPYAAEGLPGEPPKIIGAEVGCAFRDRCSRAGELCSVQVPRLDSVAQERLAACFYPVEDR